MTDSSLEGMHYEYTFFVFFYTFVHMQKSAGTWSRDTQQWALQTRKGGQGEQLFWTSVHAVQFRWSLIWNESSPPSIQSRKANMLTFLFKENCRTCHGISTDRPESFLLGGINQQGEDHRSVGLMAKLETAGFSGTQTYSETFLHTACCRSFLKMNISIT